MMSELKPCPFCGGEAKFGFSEKDYEGVYHAYIECSECGVSLNYGGASLNDLGWALVDAWNTRYKPTCTMEKNDKGYIVCSCCGHEMGFYDCGCGLGEYVYEHRYCFNCGAHVVDGDAS